MEHSYSQNEVFQEFQCKVTTFWLPETLRVKWECECAEFLAPRMVYGCCACQHLISLRSHCWNKFGGPISGPLQGCRAEMRRCLMAMPRVFFPASDFPLSRKNPLEPDSSSLYHISWHFFLFTSQLRCEVPDLPLNSVAVDLRTT